MDYIVSQEHPAKWYAELPRKQFSEFEKVLSDGWFEVYKLPCEVFAISEPHHFQEVMSFLIIGEERALLFDTGMGMGDIKSIVNKLTSLPILAVNSHTHFDHIGGNISFEPVMVCDSPEVDRLLAGVKASDIPSELTDEAFWYDGELPFNREKFSIPPCKFQKVKDGHRFSLGQRDLEVVFAKGHSDDSMVLVDRHNKILFVGDVFYPGCLYINNPQVYPTTLRYLGKKFEDYTLYCSHNEPIRPAKMLLDAADAIEDIMLGKVKAEEDETGCLCGKFDGFSIAIKK